MKTGTCPVNIGIWSPCYPVKLRTGETVREANELYWQKAGELEGGGFTYRVLPARAADTKITWHF